MRPEGLPPLLREKIAAHDILDLTVQSLGGQNYRAEINRVLSNRFCKLPADAHTLEFVGTPGHWGNPTLQDGERALVFMSLINDRFYEANWHGHLSIETVAGRLLAIAAWHLDRLGHAFGPEYLRESVVVPDASRPWRIGFPVELIERHVFEEINGAI